MKTSTAPSDSLTLVGDAALFATATFCLLAVVGAPLALILGPAAAWLLHGRHLDWKASVSGILGVVIGLVVVGGIFMILPRFGDTIGPIGGFEYAGALALLIFVSLIFITLMAALDYDGLRDLAAERRIHPRLDYARLVSTAIIILFAIIITVIQLSTL